MQANTEAKPLQRGRCAGRQHSPVKALHGREAMQVSTPCRKRRVGRSDKPLSTFSKAHIVGFTQGTIIL